jgi:predicted RNA-binding protein with TRAM domain
VPSATVVGLANGTTYTFTVTATNAVGSGLASAPSAVVTTPNVPGEPTSVIATAGVRSASVAWSAPASNGGSAVIEYTVQMSPALTGAAISVTGTTAAVTGLANGATYTFAVTATNAVGSGLASAPSALVTTPNVPGAPTSVVASAGNASASVSWLGPSSDGGSPLTGFTVVVTPPAQLAVFAISGTTATVSGLANGTSYSFQVLATNLVGTGPASAASNAVVPALPSVTTSYGPADWAGDRLSVAIPRGQSAAIFLLNTAPGQSAYVQTSLAVSGTDALPVAPAIVATLGLQAGVVSSSSEQLELELELMVARGHEAMRLAQSDAATARPSAFGLASTVAAGASLVPPSNTSFCVLAGTTRPFARSAATLVKSTPSALIYVDDLDAADFTVTEVEGLASQWETQIYTPVAATFGPPSDVDGNGQVTILFSSRVGPVSGGGIVVGYFSSTNVTYAADDSANCTGTGSNGADMFVMNTPSNLVSAGFLRSEALQKVLPSTLAHEFQHLINWNMHCIKLGSACSSSTIEALWLNEALSTLAGDVAGFGWHASRSSPKQYMKLAPLGGGMGYSQASMTTWEGDPIGNYEGVHSFLRYLVDQHGPSLLTALAGDPFLGQATTGKTNLESALGLSFSQAMSAFAVAEMFSNETNSPGSQSDFSGADWTPFHLKLRYLEYEKLNPSNPRSTTVRPDGWSAFVTGQAVLAPATLTLTSASLIKPVITVTSFSGSLPSSSSWGPPSCPAPTYLLTCSTGYSYCGGNSCCPAAYPYFCPTTGSCYTTMRAAVGACGSSCGACR